MHLIQIEHYVEHLQTAAMFLMEIFYSIDQFAMYYVINDFRNRFLDSPAHMKRLAEMLMKEDGEGLGGTSSFSVNSPAGSGLGGSDPTGQSKNTPDVPLGGIIRKGHNLGVKTDKEDKTLTPSDEAFSRGGSISVNHADDKKKKK